MNINFIHSSVFKIGALLSAISIMAIASMFSSAFISERAQNDALAVNVAGSLRMQSYNILATIQQRDTISQSLDNLEIEQIIGELEQDLTMGILSSQRTLINEESQQALFEDVINEWFEVMKPLYLSLLDGQPLQRLSLQESALLKTHQFVAKVDSLVSSFQQHAEQNIAMIRLIQILALFVTVILIAVAMLIINRHIERPLSRLTNVARQLERGDFTAVADDSGRDELAVLAKAMNKMSQSIFRSQSQLEDRVKRKTQKLLQSNATLGLLFDVASNLNTIESDKHSFDPLMRELSKVTGIKDLDLCIMTESGQAPYQHLMTSEKVLPDKCRQHDCGECADHDELFPPMDGRLRYSLKYGESNYGVLVVSPSYANHLEDWQHKLFNSVAEQIAIGLSLQQQHEQSRRIALMNERTIIARELHDSLAQALSYLKIQVARLQKLQKRDNVQLQIDEVVEELKGGLGSAYRELRELLTTFRLKLDGGTVRAAFEKAIEQLKARSDEFEFELDFQLDHMRFSPQEEIHLLQIAREAMQNAFYHSKGDLITIALYMEDESMVRLDISDNGIGISGDPTKLNHYGLAIMQERSRGLGGEFNITQNEGGGTKVVFRFQPIHMKKTA